MCAPGFLVAIAVEREVFAGTGGQHEGNKHRCSVLTERGRWRRPRSTVGNQHRGICRLALVVAYADPKQACDLVVRSILGPSDSIESIIEAHGRGTGVVWRRWALVGFNELV